MATPSEIVENAETRQPEPFRVILYYRYFAIADPETCVEEHRALCERLELKGRILIGSEGINGTVSGTLTATETYMATLHADPRTAEMPFKVDPSDGHVFPKLSVKLREEIVTLGLDAEADIDPNEVTGTRLSPAEFAEAMQDDNALLIDGRNDYESNLGRFHGAICPDIEHFRDFPAWLRQHADELKGKKVLTYCTGGIRCEKLSGYLVNEGFEDVYQLDGGIINYSHDPATRGENFDGLCYVFDGRVGVEVNHTDTRRIISQCRHCGETSPRYKNCAFPPCNTQIFVCESCEASFGRFCDETCRASATA